MAQVSLRVMRAGEPLTGAKVIVGEGLKEFTTNAQGRVTKNVPSDWGPEAVQIIIEAPGITMGGGPYKLERDVELVIEV